MTQKKKLFTKDILNISDPESMCSKIADKLYEDITKRLHRYGCIVGISGGIDSSVTLALAVKAFGNEKVLGIIMPEKDSSSASARLAGELGRHLGISTITENITASLAGFGCYQRRDEAVKSVFEEYNPDTYKMKIGIKESDFSTNLPPVFHLTIIDPDGNEKSKRLPAKAYQQIVAASNFKQRCRMAMLYYHAERLHYAVVGTSNKHEVNQGFFVKYGDGAADVMPIGHLYKSQVYQIAKHLGIAKEIINRIPTTDTYSAEQTQTEFFYQLAFEQMDLLWYAYENNYSLDEVSAVMNINTEIVKNIFISFERKSRTTEYLRMAPIRS